MRKLYFVVVVLLLCSATHSIFSQSFNPAHYVSVWDMSKAGSHATELRTNLVGNNFTVEYVQLASDNTEIAATRTVISNITTGGGTAYLHSTPYVITGLQAGARYRVRAYGGLSGLRMYTPSESTWTIGDRERLITVEQWGTAAWTYLEFAFSGAKNMNITATDVPNLAAITNLQQMFKDCSSLVYNSTINNWNVSTVQSMYNMFGGATIFNQPLGSWTTTSATEMSWMFEEARAFNQPIGNWDVDKVINMAGMFKNAHTFNQPLTGWVTSALTNMSQMFTYAKAFNQPVGHFDVDRVTLMDHVFYGATVFNQPINDWQVVSAITMHRMFNAAVAFNQPLNQWNVSGVPRMSEMFMGAASFNQNLGAWSLNALTNAVNMFDNSGIDCANYSATLRGWAANPNTPARAIELGAVNRSYNARGAEGRAALLAKGWTVNGDTQDNSCGVILWRGTISTNYNTPGNWVTNRVPDAGMDVGFDPAAVNDMHIPSGQSYTAGNYSNSTDKAIVIETNATYTIEGVVTGSETPDKAAKIHIKSAAGQPNATLILAGQPCDAPVYGTVEFYTKSFKGTAEEWTDNIPNSPTYGLKFQSSYHWQHFGVPVRSVKADPTFYGGFLREYDETYNGNNTRYYQKWRNLGNNSMLQSFKGYEVTQQAATTYWIAGQLEHCDKTVTLTRRAPAVMGADGINALHYGLGQNIFANSYTAALKISEMIIPAEVEKTVYLYNTGRFYDWGTTGSVSQTAANNAGSYLAIPVHVASTVWDDQIPSMQGFMLRFTDAQTIFGASDASVTLKYADGGVKSNTKPQLAPKAGVRTDALQVLRIGLQSASTSDNLWLIAREGTSEGFDNGWDGRKSFGTSTAFIYSDTPDGLMQVNTSETIDGKLLSFLPNGDTEYTLTITKSEADMYPNLRIVDLETKQVRLLSDKTTTFSFRASNAGVSSKRFLLTTDNITSSDVHGSEFVESLQAVYAHANRSIVVANYTGQEAVLRLTSATGQLLKQVMIPEGASTVALEKNLPAGVYVVLMEAGAERSSIKVIVP